VALIVAAGAGESKAMLNSSGDWKGYFPKTATVQ
jgi:hypothetical protein